MQHRCADCDKPITFARSAKGFKVPTDPDGTPHKRTCKGRHIHHKSARTARDAERASRTKR
jgi:hypothetical protein